MNLKSCDSCGVLIDLDKISVPDIYLADGSIDTERAVWNGKDFVPVVPCPVCKSRIEVS